MTKLLSKPMMLIILDGWGYREEISNNAIAAANKPNWDKLWQTCPRTLISGSGLDVGLPSGQMGNSEVGHLNLGSGRVVYQDYTRISQSLEQGDFYNNTVFIEALKSAQANNSKVHIMGLLSPGGVHSHEDHFFAMLELALKQNIANIACHAFLDGRDMPPQSARPSLEKLHQLCSKSESAHLASISGRYYAMDRDQRWDRIASVYNMLTIGEADYHYDDALMALEAAYEREETDEFVKPTLIGHQHRIQDDDVVIFMNYRSDRARQLSRAFIEPDFSGFQRQQVPALSHFVSLTQYAADIASEVAYPPLEHKNVLGEYLASLNLKQLRMAETEKYAHVTFFFNGGRETPFNGEERELIPSPDVATYDLQPEMNAFLVTDKLVEAIQEQQYDVIVVNFANPDMVGHTGNFNAAVKAIEAVDLCLGRIIDVLEETGGEALITADHGNAEKMQDHETGQKHTAHTSEPVPCIYFGRKAQTMMNDGVLADIAPTLLHIMGLDIPEEMTGRPLFQLI